MQRMPVQCSRHVLPHNSQCSFYAFDKMLHNAMLGPPPLLRLRRVFLRAVKEDSIHTSNSIGMIGSTA